MANCTKCGGKLGILGGCSNCETQRKNEIDARTIAYRENREKSDATQREQERQQKKQKQSAVSNMVVTTEAWVGEVERLGVVASEVVLGMNIFKDVLANVRDVFGGRSGVVQNTLAQARQVAFEELKVQAVELGADAVIAVDIDYHTVSTGNAVNMMMVAVSGTAVKLK